MPGNRPLSYESSGVLDNTQLGLDLLVKRVSQTAAFRSTGPGRRVVDIGFFASVVEITDTLGLALCTDGVGSKVLTLSVSRSLPSLASWWMMVAVITLVMEPT